MRPSAAEELAHQIVPRMRNKRTALHEAEAYIGAMLFARINEFDDRVDPVEFVASQRRGCQEDGLAHGLRRNLYGRLWL